MIGHLLLRTNLILNSGFEQTNSQKLPVGFEIKGSAKWRYAGYTDEISTYGVALEPKPKTGGSVSQMVKSIDPSRGKWLYFSFRGRAEEDFKVEGSQLYIKLDFYTNQGKKFLETAERLIYKLVEKDREVFTANGNQGKRGSTVWRTYDFEELLPFKECDSILITVGFKNGASTKDKTFDFLVDDWFLEQSKESKTGKIDPSDKATPARPKIERDDLLPLGGRWYSLKRNGTAATKFSSSNSADLIYDDGELSAPFAGSMDSWLREGHMDSNRQVVKIDRYLPDNLTISLEGKNLIVRSKNIPNHPTAIFPDTYGSQGYNPSFIGEQNMSFSVPLEPKKNPNAIAMTHGNANGALNMGPVGFAVNGVIFYNPFDAGMDDASSIMDRCCGHPSPDFAYHYHKYPICVNTPFVDRGETHSGIIGFALDGFPVYGPYENKDQFARDSKTNPLSAFNAHYDEKRGWHYHTTPGKFPYMIGGYIGTAQRRMR